MHKKKEEKIQDAAAGDVKKEETSHFCIVCNRTLSSKIYYDIHIGSKTHKRLARKYKSTRNSDALPPDASQKVGRSMLVSAVSASTEPESARKKYRTRYITTDDDYNEHLKKYVTDIVTYLSLKLALDSNVQEFQISVNDKAWKSFGDIVIDLVYKAKKIIYAIKCKQVSSSEKQVEDLKEAKIIIEKEFRYLSQLKNQLADVKFVIFTPCSTSSSFPTSVQVSKDVLNSFTTTPEKEKLSEKIDVFVDRLKRKNEIINTNGDCETIFKFFVDDDRIFLPEMYVYTKQLVHPRMIYDTIMKKIEIKKHNIHQEYNRYIHNWGKGRHGGYHKLSRHDVVLKLGELLLTPYVSLPRNINLKHDSFAIWNEVMSHVDLTVLAWENSIISKISQPINVHIERAFGVKIDATDRSINLQNKINDHTDDIIKAYLFEEVNNVDDDIPLSQIYRVLWKAGMVPILLSTENDLDGTNFILEVICLMKQYDVHKKFLLKTTNPEMVKPRCNMVIFRCLDDIKMFVRLGDISIRISEDYTLSLESIAYFDKFVFKWITPNIFFDLSMGKYALKKNTYNKHDYEVESKIVLCADTSAEVHNALYGEKNTKSTGLDRLHNISPNMF